MQDFSATCTLSPHCSLIRSVLALDNLTCQTTLLVSAAKEGNAVKFGETFGLYTKEAGYASV